MKHSEIGFFTYLIGKLGPSGQAVRCDGQQPLPAQTSPSGQPGTVYQNPQRTATARALPGTYCTGQARDKDTHSVLFKSAKHRSPLNGHQRQGS